MYEDFISYQVIKITNLAENFFYTDDVIAM